MEKTKQQKAKDFIINNGVIIVMFILVIYTGLTSDNFLTRNNLMNILMNMSSRLVIALGIAGCVITAGCDLSAGRMIGFAACIAGTLLQRIDYSGKFFPDMQPMNVFLALIVVMAICAAFGSITGFFIAYLSVPPFIATLAMMEIVYGISLIYTGATPLGGYVKSYTDIANGKFLGISWLIWIAILVAVITWFIFNMTRHGKYMYAIGGNPQAAEVAGVPVKATMILIYMKAAAMYGLAGFMLGAKAGGASVNLGYGYEMEAIAACTIGGVSVTGGRGKVSSAIIGVAVFELLKAALQYLGVDANAQYIAIGIVIFVAISLGDDGAEASCFSVLPTFFKDASVAYESQMNDRSFEKLTGYKFSEFMKIDLVNPYLEDGRIHNNCSKYLLYNDPLIGTFDSVVKEDTAERFAQAEIYMEQAASHGCLAYMFNNMQLLCIVLKHKADLGIRIRKAYTEGEKKELLAIAREDIPVIRRELDAFYVAFEKQWKRENKSFGFEIQTIRIGGLDRRLADTARILKQYANGELACIEELEETYQPFCYFEKNNIEELNYNLWSDIVSPSVIG